MAGGVAQSKGPEFKTQHWKKKKVYYIINKWGEGMGLTGLNSVVIGTQRL
jgi:hypothetical protein